MHTPLANLLVADHDALGRRRLRDHLEQEGFNVREAPDGSTLITQMQQQLPHLVVLDLQLPPMSGIELCRRVKRYGDIPIVVLTAIDDEDTKLEVLDLYAEDYVVKPAGHAEGTFRLTPMESRLLQLLVRNAGQVLPTELLLERIWGDTYVSANRLWEYVRRVRHKIGDRATKPRYIQNEPGLGYRFCGPATAGAVGWD